MIKFSDFMPVDFPDMLFDRTGFADLVHKISGDTPFDFFACIDKKWDMFVSEYMRKH